MKYLGLPISDKRLSKAELNDSPEKIEKRLQTWKCGHLSSGGSQFSSILAFQAYQCILWVSTGSMRVFIRCLILAEVNSSGKVWGTRKSII